MSTFGSFLLSRLAQFIVQSFEGIFLFTSLLIFVITSATNQELWKFNTSAYFFIHFFRCLCVIATLSMSTSIHNMYSALNKVMFTFCYIPLSFLLNIMFLYSIGLSDFLLMQLYIAITIFSGA